MVWGQVWVSPSSRSDTVPVLITAALPADQGVCLFPLCRCHAVKGTVRPALQRRQVVYMGYLSCVPSIFRFCRSPRKGFLPHSCGVFRRWHAPRSFGTTCPEVTSGQSVQKSGSLRCFPGRGIPFRTVIRFSRCGSSMNYPKSTPKRPPVPYIRKVGNPPKKLPISTLSELW